MKLKTIVLTLFLVVGISFQNCTDDPICSCPEVLDFFDIQDMDVINIKEEEPNRRSTIVSGDIIDFNEYGFLNLSFDVDFIAMQESRWSNFSLIPSAFACSCLGDGSLGSKEERIKELTIITLNDFDADHLEQDTINDLFEVLNIDNPLNLETFLATDNSLIWLDQIWLRLIKKPEINPEFKVKVKLELSTDEIYEVESTPFFLQ